MFLLLGSKTKRRSSALSSRTSLRIFNFLLSSNSASFSTSFDFWTWKGIFNNYLIGVFFSSSFSQLFLYENPLVLYASIIFSLFSMSPTSGKVWAGNIFMQFFKRCIGFYQMRRTPRIIHRCYGVE